jgi:hypothetical protein
LSHVSSLAEFKGVRPMPRSRLLGHLRWPFGCGTLSGRAGEMPMPFQHGREIWRSFVLYALFFVLLIAGRRALPGGESILPLYVIVASAAAPAFIARFWR